MKVEVTLHGVAHGGEAVGRIGEMVAFVGYGLPGERVAAELVERRPRFVRGRTVEVLEASPDRVTPPCPIFGTCGGCHWQHAGYEAQLRYKTEVLRDQLTRVARIAEPPIEPAVPSPSEWHYRNTVQLVPAQAAGERLLCFQQAHSHAPVPVEHCFISDPLINQAIVEGPWASLSEPAWQALAGVVLRVVPERALQVTLLSERNVRGAEARSFVDAARRTLPRLTGVLSGRARGDETRVLWGSGALEYELAGRRFQVPAGAFFQVNTGATLRALDLVIEWLDPRPEERVLDLYAGVGTFALALAGRAGSVTAVESHQAAASAAVGNAAANGLTNVLVVTQPVERAVARPGGPVDLAVLDPPRKGCAREVLEGLAKLGPRRMAYVSCEPSTLARDVQALGGLGYRLTRACVVDFFPQTYHLESVLLLERD